MSRAKPSSKPAEKVEAAAPAPVAPLTEQPAAPAPEPAPAQPVEPLDDFLHRIECAHIDRDVYAVAATHPEATARIWPGTYSGIRLSRGDVSVTYSDGSQA